MDFPGRLFPLLLGTVKWPGKEMPGFVLNVAPSTVFSAWTRKLGAPNNEGQGPEVVTARFR